MNLKWEEIAEKFLATDTGPTDQAVVFDSKELTNWDGFAGIVVVRCAAILRHKEQGHFNLNTQANWTQQLILYLTSDRFLPFGRRPNRIFKQRRGRISFGKKNTRVTAPVT